MTPCKDLSDIARHLSSGRRLCAHLSRSCGSVCAVCHGQVAASPKRGCPQQPEGHSKQDTNLDGLVSTWHLCMVLAGCFVWLGVFNFSNCICSCLIHSHMVQLLQCAPRLHRLAMGARGNGQGRPQFPLSITWLGPGQRQFTALFRQPQSSAAAF